MIGFVLLLRSSIEILSYRNYCKRCKNYLRLKSPSKKIRVVLASQAIQNHPNTCKLENLAINLFSLNQRSITDSSPSFSLSSLPKVHKTGCPFRPIVSSVNTYNYNLASFLVNVLNPISMNHGLFHFCGLSEVASAQ